MNNESRYPYSFNNIEGISFYCGDNTRIIYYVEWATGNDTRLSWEENGNSFEDTFETGYVTSNLNTGKWTACEDKINSKYGWRI